MIALACGLYSDRFVPGDDDPPEPIDADYEHAIARLVSNADLVREFVVESQGFADYVKRHNVPDDRASENDAILKYVFSELIAADAEWMAAFRLHQRDAIEGIATQAVVDRMNEYRQERRHGC